VGPMSFDNVVYENVEDRKKSEFFVDVLWMFLFDNVPK